MEIILCSGLISKEEPDEKKKKQSDFSSSLSLFICLVILVENIDKWTLAVLMQV